VVRLIKQDLTLEPEAAQNFLGKTLDSNDYFMSQRQSGNRKILKFFL
jgi:hypothetical protein